MFTDDEVPITDLQYAEYMELDELQLLYICSLNVH